MGEHRTSQDLRTRRTLEKSPSPTFRGAACGNEGGRQEPFMQPPNFTQQLRGPGTTDLEEVIPEVKDVRP